MDLSKLENLASLFTGRRILDGSQSGCPEYTSLRTSTVHHDNGEHPAKPTGGEGDQRQEAPRRHIPLRIDPDTSVEQSAKTHLNRQPPRKLVKGPRSLPPPGAAQERLNVRPETGSHRRDDLAGVAEGQRPVHQDPNSLSLGPTILQTGPV